MPTDDRVEPVDPKPPPESKPTLALDKTQIIQAQLKQVLDAIGQQRSETSDNFAKLSANVDMVSNDLGLVKERIGIIEVWRHDVDSRASRNSARAQQASNHDMEADAKLAAVITWRAGVDEKLAQVPTKEDLAKTTLAQTNQLIDSLKKNPYVSKALTILGTAIVTYLATHFGVHL